MRDYIAAQPGGKSPRINKVPGLLKEMVEDGVIEESGARKNRLYKLA